MKVVNGRGFQFVPPQIARYFAFLRRNVHLKKSVKYKSSAQINKKMPRDVRGADWTSQPAIRKFALTYPWVMPPLKLSQGAFS
jgi:hypothetical protein